MGHRLKNPVWLGCGFFLLCWIMISGMCITIYPDTKWSKKISKWIKSKQTEEHVSIKVAWSLMRQGPYPRHTYDNTQITKRTRDGVWSEEKVSQSCPTLWDPMDCPWNFPDQNTGMGSWISLLQGIFQPRDRTQVSHIAGGFFGIFPTQESNQGLPHCRRLLYQSCSLFLPFQPALVSLGCLPGRAAQTLIPEGSESWFS